MRKKMKGRKTYYKNASYNKDNFSRGFGKPNNNEGITPTALNFTFYRSFHTKFKHLIILN